jgi:hypothetical protein
LSNFSIELVHSLKGNETGIVRQSADSARVTSPIHITDTGIVTVKRYHFLFDLKTYMCQRYSLRVFPSAGAGVSPADAFD